MTLQMIVKIPNKVQLKQYLILQFLLKQKGIRAEFKLFGKEKNIFLNSPFHYKTVKSHINIPTLLLTIYIPSNLLKIKWQGLLIYKQKCFKINLQL